MVIWVITCGCDLSLAVYDATYKDHELDYFYTLNLIFGVSVVIGTIYSYTSLYISMESYNKQ